MTTLGCKHSVIKHIQQQDLNIRIWWTCSNLLSAKWWTTELEAISFFQEHRIFKNIDHSQSKQSGNWSMQSDPMSRVLLGHSCHYLLACCCGCFQLSSSGTFTSFEIIVLVQKFAAEAGRVALESQRSFCQHCLRAGITNVSSHASLFLQCGFLGSNLCLSNWTILPA